MLGSTAPAGFDVLNETFGPDFPCQAVMDEMHQGIFHTAVTTGLPTKKGLALGWASMGIICCDLLWTPYIVRAFTAFGAALTFLVIGIAVLAIAFIVVIFVKNTPEEKGCYPDNNPTPDEHRTLMAQVTKQYKSDWSAVRLFKRRETWLVGIAGGMLWMGSSGPIISFFPPYDRTEL